MTDTNASDGPVLTPGEVDEIEARYKPDRNGALAFRQSDAAARDVPKLIAALRASQAEVERLRGEGSK